MSVFDDDLVTKPLSKVEVIESSLRSDIGAIINFVKDSCKIIPSINGYEFYQEVIREFLKHKTELIYNLSEQTGEVIYDIDLMLYNELCNIKLLVDVSFLEYKWTRMPYGNTYQLIQTLSQKHVEFEIYLDE